MAKKAPAPPVPSSGETQVVRFIETVEVVDVSNDLHFAVGDVVTLPYASAQRWIRRAKAVEHIEAEAPPPALETPADDDDSAAAPAAL